MTKRQPAGASIDISVATEPDAGAAAKAWVARRLRFEHLIASLEREAGYRPRTDRTPHS